MIDIKLKEELKKYLEEHYVQIDNVLEKSSTSENFNQITRYKRNKRFELSNGEEIFDFVQDSSYSQKDYFSENLTLNEYLKKQLQNFNDILRNHIRNYNKKNNTKDSDIYKKANIPKEHFNKIINQKIKPQKKPLIALGIALDLAKEEIEKLLNSAGFAFTNTSKFDVIVLFCLEKNIRDIITINEILYENGEDCLGNTK